MLHHALLELTVRHRVTTRGPSTVERTELVVGNVQLDPAVVEYVRVAYGFERLVTRSFKQAAGKFTQV